MDFLFPRKCEICEKEGSLLCDWCKKKLEKPPETIDKKRLKWGLRGVTALYSFKDPKLRHLIERIKFGFCDALIPELMPERINLDDFDLIVPIPLHFFRKNWRGFNQAEVIARNIDRKRVVNLLSRKKNTKQQARLKSHEERKKNIKDAFEIKGPPYARGFGGARQHSMVRGKKILLVDDVFTTGESMGEACKTLKAAGAKYVWGFVLAR